MPQDEVRRLEATIAALEAQQEADRRELLAARAETRAIRAVANEAQVIADQLGTDGVQPSFLKRNWPALLAAALMAPLIIVMMLMLDRATARADACQSRIFGQATEPDPPLQDVPPPTHTRPPKQVRAASTGEPIGVPACDKYLNSYSVCVQDKIPAAQRELMQRSLVTMREAWRKAAATEAGRRSMALACETATATARKSMAAFKCQW